MNNVAFPQCCSCTLLFIQRVAGRPFVWLTSCVMEAEHVTVSSTWARACTVSQVCNPAASQPCALHGGAQSVFQFVLDVLCQYETHCSGLPIVGARKCKCMYLSWTCCMMLPVLYLCVAQPSFMWLSSVSRYSGRVATAVRQFDPHPRGWCCGETSGHLQWKLLTPTQVRRSDAVVLTVFCVVTILLSSFCAVKVKLVSISTL